MFRVIFFSLNNIPFLLHRKKVLSFLIWFSFFLFFFLWIIFLFSLLHGIFTHKNFDVSSRLICSHETEQFFITLWTFSLRKWGRKCMCYASWLELREFSCFWRMNFSRAIEAPSCCGSERIFCFMLADWMNEWVIILSNKFILTTFLLFLLGWYESTLLQLYV
jgi:hypothetical protein